MDKRKLHWTIFWREIRGSGQADGLAWTLLEASKGSAAGLVLDSNHPGLRHLAGNLAYARGEYSEALEHFLIARSRPNSAGAMLRAARCHVRLGDPASATALLDELLSRAPDHVQARRMRDDLARPRGKG